MRCARGNFEVEDFLANVRRAAAVHHEALMPFMTGGTRDGFAFAIAKAVLGPSLDEVLAKDGPFDEQRALALACALAGALASLERGGMRHGDLAPRRIVVAGPRTFVLKPPRLLPTTLCPHDERHQAPRNRAVPRAAWRAISSWSACCSSRP